MGKHFRFCFVLQIVQAWSWHFHRWIELPNHFCCNIPRTTGQNLLDSREFSRQSRLVFKSNQNTFIAGASTSTSQKQITNAVDFHARAARMMVVPALMLLLQICYVDSVASATVVEPFRQDKGSTITSSVALLGREEKLVDYSLEIEEPLKIAQTIKTTLENRNNQNGPKNHLWQFENGQVTLPDKLNILGCKLKNPVLLGSGAGGAVFVLQQENPISYGPLPLIPIINNDPVVLKVSWKGSTTEVINECEVLNLLQQESIVKHHSISTTENCLGQVAYEPDPSRTMIALQPFFSDEQVSSVQDLIRDPSLFEYSITLIIQTMLRMISVNIVTIDIQPLISRTTGQLLFVDFTEATTLRSKEDRNEDRERLLTSNFVNEMMNLIPFSQQETIASKILLQELSAGCYKIQSIDFYEAMLNQNLSPKTLAYIEKQLNLLSSQHSIER
jgi:hypothetical protein